MRTMIFLLQNLPFAERLQLQTSRNFTVPNLILIPYGLSIHKIHYYSTHLSRSLCDKTHGSHDHEREREKTIDEEGVTPFNTIFWLVAGVFPFLASIQPCACFWYVWCANVRVCALSFFSSFSLTAIEIYEPANKLKRCVVLFSTHIAHKASKYRP